MKYCPNCQTSYTDDSLKFCLQDGTPLKESFVTAEVPMETVAFDDAETLMTSRQVEPIRVPIQNQPSQNWQQAAAPPIIAVQPAARKSRTGLAVGLTVLGMLLIFGIAGIGALMYFRDKKTQVAVNVNTAPPAVNRLFNANPASNQAANQNVNANFANISPTPTATMKPALGPEEAKNVITDVEYVIDDWEEATENLEIDRNMGNYADTVDYYNGGRVGVARVRADKQRAFEQYDSINVNISNLKITPDGAGDKATALFDKEWEFEGDEKSSSGKVRQQLTFSKINGKWKITGEKDLKVYYVKN